jgi:hypothetical protein
MSQMINNPEALDGLLSDFFKSRMRHPWPAAPVPMSAVPSSLVAARNQPSADAAKRARVTLAASVALLLGTCWYLSGGSQPDLRNTPRPNGGTGPSILNEGSAQQPREFDKGREKAKTTQNPMTGFKPGPIDLP